MNSRSGISTPVESMSTVTTTAGFGAVAELANALEGSVHCLAAGNLLNKAIALAETHRGRCQRAGPRVRYAAGRLRRKLTSWEIAHNDASCSKCVFLYLFKNLAVRVGRRDFLLDLSAVELPLIFQKVESALLPSPGPHRPTSSPSLRKTPFIRTFERTATGVVIDQVTFAHGPLIFIAIHDVFEISGCVRRRAWQ